MHTKFIDATDIISASWRDISESSAVENALFIGVRERPHMEKF